MIRVGIVGATGYTGAELVRLIAGHPETDLAAVTSEKYAGLPFPDIFPAFRGIVDMKCRQYDRDRLASDTDLIFLALPHQISMRYAPELIEKNVKVIDLSADFRFSSAERYESVYQPHTARELLQTSVYGLSEVYRDSIRQSRLVGNPGCYPTSFLLPVIPLAEAGAITGAMIISDSKSGVSGAGRSLSLTTHFCEANESFKPYKIGNHRHTPEMEEVLRFHASRDIRITFTPHLLPLTRGMLTTVYAPAEKSVTENDLRDILKDYYADTFFPRILPAGAFPDTKHVCGTNFCDIGLHLEAKTGNIIIVSAIDNLLKGAAGQAVQNMNIMFDLNEKTGLL